jgi:lipopolysaccharide export system permease protein
MTVCEMQAERTKAAAQYARAYRRLERVAEAGRKAGDTIQLPRRRSTGGGGLGDVYCAAQSAIVARLGPEAPADSMATATAAPPSDSATPGADAARRISVPVLPEERRAGPPAAADTANEPPITIAPSAGGLQGQSEAARLEAERQRQLLNSYDVEIHKKFALAAAIVVFVLLGPPIALRFPRGGVGLVIGVSLGVFALYYVCLIAGETVADKGYVPAPLAMWAANIVFTAAAVVLLARMGREATTGRGGDWGELKEAARQRLAALLRRVGIRAERRQVA